MPGGEAIQLTDYRGQYVLVNFWASWCDPCRGETPDLQRFFEGHGTSEFTIIGVNQQESTEKAAQFASEFSVTYPIALDRDGSVSNAYRT